MIYTIVAVLIISTVAIAQNVTQACIPQNDPNPTARAAVVADRLAGFLYGPSLIGQAAPFPNGTLGKERVASDMALWSIDRNIIDADVQADAINDMKAIQANGGLKTMADYVNILYKGEWNESNPLGEAPGIMTNFTQDLLFSMERLSQNSYPLRLVNQSEELPFELDDGLVINITGVSLSDLQDSNSLFVVDHSYQSRYPATTVAPQRYGAFCTAYFFIHPESGDFLPLAIKTNTGSDLIYTPLDQPTDWLLAKMMFNVNDMFHSQMFHLVVTHDVSEGVHLAALRTLSPNHPIMVILERLMLQAYSSRPVGEELCFNPGGHWDQLFFINNVGCRQFVNDTWPVQGGYQGSYLYTDLQARGLIDESGNYPFKSFPFYEDASVILDSFNSFFTDFVNSYYPTEDELDGDYEVQNWFNEVSEGAKVYDFPPFCTKQVLIDVLTHFAHIVSVVHHSLNGGDPVGSKATLPFHLNALYAPVPTEKGVTDLLPFLPPAPDAVHYIGFLATFNRPFYRTTERTLEYAFNNATLLATLNEDTNNAASTFWDQMTKMSAEVRSRGFDGDGLSNGMPFVYRTLDPGYIPFFSCV